MMPYRNQNQQMHAAVGRVLGEALAVTGERAGFMLMGGSILPRRVDCGQWTELTLPAMPARNDDGSVD